MLRVLASLFTVCLVVSSAAAIPADMNPSDIVNGQFAAVPAITSASSPNNVAQWLVGMDDIFTRVATGA